MYVKLKEVEKMIKCSEVPWPKSLTFAENGFDSKNERSKVMAFLRTVAVLSSRRSMAFLTMRSIQANGTASLVFKSFQM